MDATTLLVVALLVVFLLAFNGLSVIESWVGSLTGQSS